MDRLRCTARQRERGVKKIWTDGDTQREGERREMRKERKRDSDTQREEVIYICIQREKEGGRGREREIERGREGQIEYERGRQKHRERERGRELFLDSDASPIFRFLFLYLLNKLMNFFSFNFLTFSGQLAPFAMLLCCIALMPFRGIFKECGTAVPMVKIIFQHVDIFLHLFLILFNSIR